jgi:CHAT domain-containing protein
MRNPNLPKDKSTSAQTNDNPLSQLYQLLIQPIADLLPSHPEDHLILIPQRSLFLVPFAALPDPTGKYLIEQHTIAIAPSIQVLDLTYQLRKQHQDSSQNKNSQNKNNDAVLIVGNPTMPKITIQAGEAPEQLPDLPGAETEANAIAKIFYTQALTGDRANKSKVVDRMSHSQLIHLATHGLLNDFPGLGVPGAIALGPDPNFQPKTPGVDNGILTASEILDLKLSDADLVVLSACNTGRGKITGDGVVGLSRSLVAAQVPSVIVSLWSVPDLPTSLLMTEFYRQIKTQPDKAQALRQSMLSTIKQYPDALDWAAFTLIGEP